jgi:signal transduction histidine kinase
LNPLETEDGVLAMSAIRYITARKAKGIGLGLSVARRLARANGAEISVRSQPGRGSRFEVRFSAQASETVDV